jgi:uncharacterized membrane protein
MYDVLMVLGAAAGCHQLPERSFFFKGYQFPLCARCTGILIGQMLALPLWLLYQPSLRLSVLLIIPMACDGILQYAFSVMSNNGRRVVTGLLAGYGYTSVHLHLLLLGVGWLKTML